MRIGKLPSRVWWMTSELKRFSSGITTSTTTAMPANFQPSSAQNVSGGGLERRSTIEPVNAYSATSVMAIALVSRGLNTSHCSVPRGEGVLRAVIGGRWPPGAARQARGRAGAGAPRAAAGPGREGQGQRLRAAAGSPLEQLPVHLRQVVRVVAVQGAVAVAVVEV